MSSFASGVRTSEERTNLLGTIVGLPSRSAAIRAPADARRSGGHTRGHQPQPGTFRLRWRSSQTLPPRLMCQGAACHDRARLVWGSPIGHEILGWPEPAPIRGRVLSAWSRTWVRSTPSGNVRVSTRFRFTQLSRAVKNGVPPPTRTGWVTIAYSSISSARMAAAARVAPPASLLALTHSCHG